MGTRGRPPGIAVTAGDPVLLADLLAAHRSGRRSGSRRLRIELEVETGLGRGGFVPDDVVVAAAAIARRRRRSSAACGPTSRPPRTRSGRPRSSDGSRPPTSALRAAGIRLPARHATASAGLVSRDGLAAYDGVRPGLAIYGLAPDELRRRRGGGRAVSAPPAGPVAPCATRPRRGPAQRVGDQLWPDLRHRAAQPDRDPAARLRRRLVAGALESGERPGPRPAGPDRRQRGDGRRHGRRDRRPRPAGHAGRRVHPDRAQGGRSDHRRRAGAGAHHELVGSRHGHGSAATPGVRCRDPDRSVCARSPSGVDCGTHRTVERRHLRPRGRCDRQRREPLALDVDRRRRRDQARRRRRDRVRGRPPGPGPARRRDRDDRRDPRRPRGHPCRLARPRAADQRAGHRGGRPLGDGPGPRDRRDEHRLPRARDRRRRVPARRGCPHHRPDGARGTALVSYHRPRDLRAARSGRLRGVRRGPGEPATGHRPPDLAIVGGTV